MTEAIRWILNDYACVIDGWCYGVAPTGRNVCLGTVADLQSTPEKAPEPYMGDLTTHTRKAIESNIKEK